MPLICCRDPEWADVKIAQAKYLLSRLAEFKMLVSGKFDCSPSIIVAGDFNSIPGDQVSQVIYTVFFKNFHDTLCYLEEVSLIIG